MSDELEEGYQKYLQQIQRFCELEKTELALILARLCVLEPHLPAQIEKELPAIKLVKDYVKYEINNSHHVNQNA